MKWIHKFSFFFCGRGYSKDSRCIFLGLLLLIFISLKIQTQLFDLAGLITWMIRGLITVILPIILKIRGPYLSMGMQERRSDRTHYNCTQHYTLSLLGQLDTGAPYVLLSSANNYFCSTHTFEI